MPVGLLKKNTCCCQISIFQRRLCESVCVAVSPYLFQLVCVSVCVCTDTSTTHFFPEEPAPLTTELVRMMKEMKVEDCLVEKH